MEFATQRAGHASLLMDDIDVAHVARNAVHDISPVLDPARVHVADESAMGRANTVALHRVLTNLVVNALKYSGPGSPVEVCFGHEGTGRVQITVADRGRGIDPGDLGVDLPGVQPGSHGRERRRHRARTGQRP